MLKVDSVKKKGKNVFDFRDMHFEIGILADKPTFKPKYRQYTSLGGEKVRRKSTKRGKLMISDVAKRVDVRYKFLSKPYTLRNTSQLARVINDTISVWLFDGSRLNSILNGLRAVIRQPMIEGKYKNKASTVKAKGFNRGTIDTGQLYNNIDALIVKNNKTFKRGE